MAERVADAAGARRWALPWPLQDNLSLLVVCARINHPLILPARLYCPHCCNTFARLLGNMRPSPDLPSVCHLPNNIGNNNSVERLSATRLPPPTLYMYL